MSKILCMAQTTLLGTDRRGIIKKTYLRTWTFAAWHFNIVLLTWIFFLHFLWNFVSGGHSHKLDRLRMKQKQTNQKIWSTIPSHVLWNWRRCLILTAKLKNLYSIASWYDLKNANTLDILINFTSSLQFKLRIILKKIWIVAPPLCYFLLKTISNSFK